MTATNLRGVKPCSNEPLLGSRSVPSKRWVEWFRLTFAILALLVIWLIVLPYLSRWPPIENHIAEMQANNIEVDAMFYTELNWQPPE